MPKTDENPISSLVEEFPSELVISPEKFDKIPVEDFLDPEITICSYRDGTVIEAGLMDLQRTLPHENQVRLAKLMHEIFPDGVPLVRASLVDSAWRAAYIRDPEGENLANLAHNFGLDTIGDYDTLKIRGEKYYVPRTTYESNGWGVDFLSLSIGDTYSLNVTHPNEVIVFKKGSPNPDYWRTSELAQLLEQLEREKPYETMQRVGTGPIALGELAGEAFLWSSRRRLERGDWYKNMDIISGLAVQYIADRGVTADELEERVNNFINNIPIESSDIFSGSYFAGSKTDEILPDTLANTFGRLKTSSLTRIKDAYAAVEISGEEAPLYARVVVCTVDAACEVAEAHLRGYDLHTGETYTSMRHSTQKAFSASWRKLGLPSIDY